MGDAAQTVALPGLTETPSWANSTATYATVVSRRKNASSPMNVNVLRPLIMMYVKFLPWLSYVV